MCGDMVAVLCVGVVMRQCWILDCIEWRGIAVSIDLRIVRMLRVEHGLG